MNTTTLIAELAAQFVAKNDRQDNGWNSGTQHGLTKAIVALLGFDSWGWDKGSQAADKAVWEFLLAVEDRGQTKLRPQQVNDLRRAVRRAVAAATQPSPFEAVALVTVEA
jgi:uncharacterized UPF0160 family protein